MSTDFETVQEAAVRLGLMVRAIQKQAAAGKIPGAERYGRVWMIPRCDILPVSFAPSPTLDGGIPI